MNCGLISEFDRNVICSTALVPTLIRHRSDCGKKRIRDSVAPTPGLPRVDANTMKLPSGDHAGSKLWTLSPFESAAAGVTCVHCPVAMLTVHTDNGWPFCRAANATRTPSFAT